MIPRDKQGLYEEMILLLLDEPTREALRIQRAARGRSFIETTAISPRCGPPEDRATLDATAQRAPNLI
jgi:hypothetical protein